MTIFDTAAALAKLAHAGQTDHSGQDYYQGHLLRMAARFDIPEEKAAAVLHDLFEDTELDGDDLLNLGIPEPIISTINVVTRRPDEQYNWYIVRVANSGDTLALAIKIADLEDHLEDTTAIPESLEKRYRAALDMLSK